MHIIERDDLKAKLDQGANIKLVMALGEWAFRAKRIPGSLHFASPEDSVNALQPNDEIIVYCSDEACVGSQYAYRYFEQHGFTNIHRYAGGLSDWEAAGYPLEGDMVE